MTMQIESICCCKNIGRSLTEDAKRYRPERSVRRFFPGTFGGFYLPESVTMALVTVVVSLDMRR